jgi:ribosomal protein S1
MERPPEEIQPGQELEAEVVAVDPKNRKISLSVKALRRTEERQEIESYLQRDRDQGRFSLQDVLADQLGLNSGEKKEPSS